MMKIPLSQGLFALVSDEDYDRVNAFKWSASNESRGRKKWYAVRQFRDKEGKFRKLRLSRFIMDLSFGDIRVVDHLDGDGLDNRRENLEVVYQDENMRRAKGWDNGYKKSQSHPARKPHNKKSKRKKVPEVAEANDPGEVQGSLFRETDAPAT